MPVVYAGDDDANHHADTEERTVGDRNRGNEHEEGQDREKPFGAVSVSLLENAVQFGRLAFHCLHVAMLRPGQRRAKSTLVDRQGPEVAGTTM